jgi:hypothetical protein
MLNVTLERTIFRLCQAGQLGGGFFCGSDHLRVSCVCVIRCFASIQGHCFVSLATSHNFTDASFVGFLRTDHGLDSDSVAFDGGQLTLNRTNWTGNRPSQKSAAYGGMNLGAVHVMFGHFESNHGDCLIGHFHCTDASIFTNCNFIRNGNKGSLLVMSRRTVIENSVFLGNDGKVITAVSGHPDFRIFASYSDAAVIVPGQKAMTINRLTEQPRDHCARSTHELTFVVPFEARLCQIF